MRQRRYSALRFALKSRVDFGACAQPFRAPEHHPRFPGFERFEQSRNFRVVAYVQKHGHEQMVVAEAGQFVRPLGRLRQQPQDPLPKALDSTGARQA
jgi:hypothetical protein